MAPGRITRRRFLAAAGVTLGATTLAVSGATLPGGDGPAVDLPQLTLGESTMSNRILVAYASRAGSTAEVAAAIGKTLADGGMPVDVRPMKEVQDLSPYRAVVAGSAIQGGKWLPEALDFVRGHRAELSTMPFAAFLVCITLGMKDGKYRDGVAKWLDPVRSMVRPASEGLFAGKLDLSKMPMSLDALMFRAAVTFGALPPAGDYRDWDVIRAWSMDLKRIMAA